MSKTLPAEARELLDLWFGSLDENGKASEAHVRRWWRKDPAFDRLLRERFGALHAEIAAGGHDDWRATPRGRLALVIVLDQLSRNIFRGTGDMFACDAKAVEVAREGVERGDDRALECDERVFLYMPFMHSEELASQDRCVELFGALEAELDGEAAKYIARNRKFAIQHRNIVAEWGRFPHRNELVGRSSTALELAFLEGPGSSF